MDEKITHVETYCVELPYREAIHFASVTEDRGQYLLLRIRTAGGADGIAEAVARPRFTGEDPQSMAYAVQNFFKPLLMGRNALDHNQILAEMARIDGCHAVQSLIDVALWDLKGKILNQPVYRLLGGGPVEPVPVGWIAHGNTVEAMVKQASEKVHDQGYRMLKLKTWKRSMADIEMVREIRKVVGDDLPMYCDANSRYSETEARTIFSRLADYNITFIEDPCNFKSHDRMALMAQALPVAILGDSDCETAALTQELIKLNAVGGVSIKMRRTGVTESLQIIGMCEAAGIPNVIGTDSESRIATMSRMHLRAAIPSLANLPTETHFYDKLADDCFEGEFEFNKGLITVPDKPGFGAGIDEKKLKKYQV
jgi:L-alanine-DL-glutamate epimerase-like enolase superfamily enzyme